jgi:type II secretory pathway pseudopilin PulG
MTQILRDVIRRSSDRGFSLVEGLVATAIMATTVAGTGGFSTYLVKQSRRSQRLNSAIALQSLVQNELVNREQYQLTGDATRDAQVNAINAGQASTAYTGFPLRNGTGGAIARVNQRTYHHTMDLYDQSGPCAGPSDQCQVYVDLDLYCADVARSGCTAAYRVGLDADANDVTPGALGAPNRPPTTAGLRNSLMTFAEDDYSLVLGRDLFTLMDASDPGTSCNAANEEIFITGVNRVTGEVSCLKKPSAPCPDQQVAHGVRAVNGRLEFACHPLGAVKCPPDYVFQKLDLAQLDRGDADQKSTTHPVLPLTTQLRGTCVYRWLSHIKWQRDFPNTSGSRTFTVTKQVCNATVYDAVEDGGCSYEKTSSTPGCCKNEKGDCESTPESDVTAQGRTVGAVASCTITITDNCGSSVTARPRYGGFCEAKERAQTPDLVKAPEGGLL